MSWYSDGEPFDEFEPSYCRYCTRSNISYDVCQRCRKEHDMEENEDYYREWDEI